MKCFCQYSIGNTLKWVSDAVKISDCVHYRHLYTYLYLVE